MSIQHIQPVSVRTSGDSDLGERQVFLYDTLRITPAASPGSQHDLPIAIGYLPIRVAPDLIRMLFPPLPRNISMSNGNDLNILFWDSMY